MGNCNLSAVINSIYIRETSEFANSLSGLEKSVLKMIISGTKRLLIKKGLGDFSKKNYYTTVRGFSSDFEFTMEVLNTQLLATTQY